MAASEGVVSLAGTTANLAFQGVHAVQTSPAAMKATENVPSSVFGSLGRAMLAILSVLPTLLYWITYTLPAWLFTFFSMSLTFTMNATTL